MFSRLFSKKLFVVFLCLFSLHTVTAVNLRACEDDLEDLKKQIAELKKENAALRAENLELRKELREQKNSGAGKSGGDAGEIEGKIWEITATADSGQKFGPAKFLAHNGNIYIDDLKKPRIGFYVEKGPEVRIEFKDAPVAGANGVYEMRRLGKTGSIYAGRLVNTNGKTFKVQLKIVAD
jgi:hypothetical protein